MLYVKNEVFRHKNVNVRIIITSREQHKPAPYLRLKNSKRTSKCQKSQSIKLTKNLETLPKNTHDRTGAPRVAASAGPWRAKGGTLTDFSTSILSQNIKQIERGNLWRKNYLIKMSHNAEKNGKGRPFSLAWYCISRWKNKKQLLYFSSLCLMISFRTLKFRRILYNYFGQFVWVEKRSHYYSRVYFMKRRLKIVNNRNENRTNNQTKLAHARNSSIKPDRLPREELPLTLTSGTRDRKSTSPVLVFCASNWLAESWRVVS